MLQERTESQLELAHAAYWRARLAGLGDKTCFPADLHPDPDVVLPVATYDLRLPDDLTRRLDQMSRHQPAALHVVLASALVALLRRVTRADEIVIGQPPVAGSTDRPNSMLVLRSAPAPDASFRDVLLELRTAVLEAVQHQDFPVSLLAEELGRTGAKGENPFFDVAIELVGLHDPEFAANVPVHLLFSARLDDDGLSLTLRYDASRLEALSIERIAHAYVQLLEKAGAEPDRPLRDLDLWAPEDEAIVTASNATTVAFDAEATIHAQFMRQAAATPDAVALVGAHGAMTYAELDVRSTQLAHVLRRRGIGPDAIVGVLADRSVEMIVAILGILKAGGAYLPIDPTYPAARIVYLLADSRASLALAQPKFSGLAGECPVLDLDDPASYADTTLPLEPTCTPSDLAYVIYTSGSTGNPKGVMVEHRSVINRLAWMQRAYPIGPSDRILQKTSISFDVSVWELFWWAFTGASLALLKPGGEKDPASIVEAIEAHRVTTMHFVPSMLSMFLAYVDRSPVGEQLASLRQVFASGEALSRNQVARGGELFGHSRLINLYGPTEATVDVTHQPCDELGNRARVPIGWPIDNTRLYVLDDNRRPVPVGVPGELYIAGVGLARGYLHREQLTRERFVDGETVGEQRLYRTGDLARWLPNGAIDYLGRVDLQVKIRGFRVELGEIEERLGSHPAVRDAAVTAVDQGWQTSLRGYVVLRSAATEPELKQHLRETLPEYMVPARILPLEALPLTPNGKLDRAALSRPVAGQQPAATHVEPRDEREQTLARIWREVLGKDKIGIHDNFFALGGNSIHFVSVLAKARDAGLTFTFQQLFQHQTIAALASSMADQASNRNGAVVSRGYQPFELITREDRARIPDDVEDAYPLSLLQAGLIFQTEITGGRGQYHDVLSYMIRGSFDAAAFEQAVCLLVKRHPILRTTYHLTGFSEFLQMVHRDVPPPLHVMDLRGQEAADQERWHDEWLAREKARPFVWQEGAVVSLHVEVLRDDLYRYTVSQHNSALDGWSISLLHTQLFDLYYKIREGHATDEHGVDNHLRNFIGLEREAIRSTESRDFWLGVLRDSHSTEVPRSPDARDTERFEVLMHDVPLPAGLSERVIALADNLLVPVKDVLLAAHIKVLSVVAGDRDVMTGYEHSGRPELTDAEAALGLFLNTVPLRVEIVDESWQQLIRRIYRAELDLLPHRRYPMAKMKQDLGTQGTLFETTFNFTHFYLLKNLRELPEFSLLDMRVDSETEFVFRTEVSRHFYDDDVRLCLHYHRHLFDAAQIERIGGYFIEALERMTSEPAALHTARPLMGESELGVVRKLVNGSQALLRERYPELAEADPDARVHVLDGNLTHAPLGSPGDIVIANPAWQAGQPVVRPRERGRWLADGRLEIMRSSVGPRADVPAPTPEPERSAPGAAMQRIAAVWAEVLDLPVTSLQPTDDFFALGGNSLSALRVVLQLDGLVTLSDLTRQSRLDELARLADQLQQGGQDLLHLLSSTAAGTRCALICVPHPCGHPINFRPVAEALEELTSDVAVYGVEQPGHDINRPGPFEGVAETARLMVDEIARQIRMPIILWGHCGGAAVTLEVARELEERGLDLRHVFIGSKLLPTVEDMRESVEMIDAWTDEQIIRYMVDETGYTELDGLDSQHTDFMARVFRHDVCNGYRYFINALQTPRSKLAAPFTFVAAADDAAQAHYPNEYRRWLLVASDVRLHVLGSGGHYFMRTNPIQTAELIEREWSATTALHED